MEEGAGEEGAGEDNGTSTTCRVGKYNVAYLYDDVIGCKSARGCFIGREMNECCSTAMAGRGQSVKVKGQITIHASAYHSFLFPACDCMMFLTVSSARKRSMESTEGR